MSSALNQCVQKNYMQRLKAEKELEIYKMKYEVLQEKVKKISMRHHEQERDKEIYFNFLYEKFKKMRQKQDEIIIEKIDNLQKEFKQEITVLKEISQTFLQKIDQQSSGCQNSFQIIEEKENHIYFAVNEKIDILNKEINDLKIKLDDINGKLNNVHIPDDSPKKEETISKMDTKDIFEAATKGILGAVKFYLKEDPSIINQKESFYDNWTPLHYAAFNKHLDVVKYLIVENAEIDPLSSSCFYTPLHYASFFGHISIMDFLISKGANINQQDCYNNTPLHIAALHGHIDAVKLLIVRGALQNSKNKDSKTPLDCACTRNHFLISQYLSSLNSFKN